MGAVTTAVIAGSALAYSIYQGEETKKQLRSDQDDTNKENSRIKVEADASRALSEETGVQQRARARQKGMAPNASAAAGGAGGFANGAVNINAPGKTLLGS